MKEKALNTYCLFKRSKFLTDDNMIIIVFGNCYIYELINWHCLELNYFSLVFFINLVTDSSLPQSQLH